MNNPIKQALVDILDFLKYKIVNDDCTPEEMKSVYKVLSENTVMKATTKDIAEFYDQSPSNVRNICSRRGVSGESKRYYDFQKLQKVIPKKWRSRHKAEASAKPSAYAVDESAYGIAAEPTASYGLKNDKRP